MERYLLSVPVIVILLACQQANSQQADENPKPVTASKPLQLPDPNEVAEQSAPKTLAIETREPLFIANTAADPKLVEELSRIGERLSKAKVPAEIASCNLQQADVLAKIVDTCKPEERALWLRQLVDCLHLAALNSPAHDKTAHQTLKELEAYIAGLTPGSDLAAYATLKAIEVAKLQTSEGEAAKPQEQWPVQLVRFVQTYPTYKETPNALFDLGMNNDVRGNEAEAKVWYQRLVQEFPDNPLAKKAQGALRRLDLTGNRLFLALPKLYAENDRQDEPFDIEQLRGKLVIVYCWASWDQRSLDDFASLKACVDRHGKRVELLCVNLNNGPQEAKSFLGDVQPPGIHVFQRGGLDGIWAARYGIMGLPKLMLVGKDGKVISQDLGISNLEAEIGRQMK